MLYGFKLLHMAVEKTTKLLSPHPMTFIHQNKHYNAICVQNWHSSEPVCQSVSQSIYLVQFK